MVKRLKTQPPEQGKRDELLVAFGKKVREARQKAGLTQAALGTAADLAQSYIFEIETMGANVTLKTLANLASSLRVSLKDLVPDNEFETLTPVSIAGLIAALDKVADTLAAHRVQESELLAYLRSYEALRNQLEVIVEKSVNE